ncbi:MAG: glycerophosphodiester phosphodiesterase family protein [Planctomycetota bacterium]
MSGLGGDARAQDAPSRVGELRRLLLEDVDDGVLVVAHRGHHADAPENSVAAIEAAIAIGAHLVEVDVRATRDRRLVLMHDRNVGRTTTGWGDIDTMPYEDVRRLRLLQGIRPTAHRAPTLAEAMATARGAVLVNLDLKGVSLERAAEAVHGLGMLDHCVFKVEWSEGGAEQGRRARARWPGLIVMPMVCTEAQMRRALGDADDSPIEFVVRDRDASHITDEALAAVRASGRRAWANALGDWNLPGLGDYDVPDLGGAVYTRLAERGFTLVQTDLPEVAIRALGAPAGLEREPSSSGPAAARP